jgi:hypothetical protein
MNTSEGTLYDDPDKMKQLLEEDPASVETFEHGEVIQVKDGFFEVVKVDIRKQRLVLKPVPKPVDKQAEVDDLSGQLTALREGFSRAERERG